MVTYLYDIVVRFMYMGLSYYQKFTFCVSTSFPFVSLQLSRRFGCVVCGKLPFTIFCLLFNRSFLRFRTRYQTTESWTDVRTTDSVPGLCRATYYVLPDQWVPVNVPFSTNLTLGQP